MTRSKATGKILFYRLTFFSTIGLIGTAAPSAFGTIAQWDFNGSLASSTGGSNLVAGAAAPAANHGVTFSSATINGQSAQVASFTRGTWFRATHGLGANGDGAFLNVYTLIMDVMFPSRPTGWAALWQTSPANASGNDGDWFINPAGGVGISGIYGGSVPNGVWHRLTLVVDSVGGTLTSYINGTQAQQLGGLSLDGRWSLEPDALLFADENQENAAGLVNSVQLRPEPMLAADIAALGGPSASGIPMPSPPTLQVITPNGGESFQAGSTQLVSWGATDASGLVQVDVYRGDTHYRRLGEVAMRQSNFTWVVSSRFGDATNYRVRIASSTFPGVDDFCDGFFTVFGSGPPANPLFGQPLQANGGFEQSLANWQTMSGSPRALTSGGGKGSPHSGSAFLHGGPGNSAAMTVRQEVDLIAAGFTAQDIDMGASLDAEAWLRNWYAAGNFDDQVYYSVDCLDAAGQSLGAIRCMVAAHDLWLVKRLTKLLPVGTRRLRLEIVGKHRRDADNDSMADDLIVRLQESTGAVTPQITKLPMLQDVRPDAMTLLWETDGNMAQHAVDWGRSNVAENTLVAVETLQIDTSHFVHRATLEALSTETRYVYRVRSGTNVTSVFAFRTAPHRETPFAVAWWGDNHNGTVTLRQHIVNLSAHGPDFIAVAGDMVNSGNILTEWHDYWFKPLEHLSLGQTKPIIFARGNHDGEHALAYAYSKLPGNEAWFAFDYGNSRFIFLDSEVSSSGSPEQLAWLRTELERPDTRKAAFRIVCFHRPPWVNLWNGGGYTGETFVRNDWTPLFAQGRVDIVICGHAHNYNRGETNGVTYIISGGGGGTLDVERVANWPLFTVEYSRYHYGLMEINDDTLLWEVYDNNNGLIDTTTLKSRTPSLQWASFTPVGGDLPLVVSARAGTSYVLDQSPDLASWIPIATNTVASNGFRTNSIPLGTMQRFFRARTQ